MAELWLRPLQRGARILTDIITFTKAYGTDRRVALNAAVWAKSEGRCWYCGATVELLSTNPDTLMSVDHFVSQADGGDDDLSNLVPACRSCNSGKGRRSVETFRWTLYRKANGIPNFSLEQRDWLTAQGFDFIGLPSTLFWFEREGLS
jgi:5-methylcytosine-specific restriction endonuclease McrA